ncbi:MAG: hypothetical protein AAF628_10415 [Planctomycetota bacterium]
MRLALAVAGGLTAGAVGLLAVDRALEPTPPGHALAQTFDNTFAVERRFPNVELRTHDGRSVRFYDDLVRGKIVALNFMYVACTKF